MQNKSAKMSSQESAESGKFIQAEITSNSASTKLGTTLPMVENNYNMTTRSMVGTIKPNPKYMLQTIKIPSIPKRIKSALKDTEWVKENSA